MLVPFATVKSLAKLPNDSTKVLLENVAYFHSSVASMLRFLLLSSETVSKNEKFIHSNYASVWYIIYIWSEEECPYHVNNNELIN